MSFFTRMLVNLLCLVVRLMQVGEEFSGAKSESLEESIRRQSLNYFRSYHRAKLDELRMFLENEGWELCPVKPSFSILMLQVRLYLPWTCTFLLLYFYYIFMFLKYLYLVVFSLHCYVTELFFMCCCTVKNYSLWLDEGIAFLNRPSVYCCRRYLFVRLFVHLFVQADLVTMISLERLEQSQWKFTGNIH